MNIPIIGSVIDERFLQHRLRSTSLAGIVGAVFAAILFGHRYFVDGIWSWDLLAIVVAIAVVKVVTLVWYRITD